MTDTQSLNQLVLAALYGAMDELNESLPDGARLEKDLDAVLFGKSDSIDSMDFVKLLIIFEEKVGDDADATISVMDDRALSQDNSPFRTVRSLVDYTTKLLEEAEDA